MSFLDPTYNAVAASRRPPQPQPGMIWDEAGAQWIWPPTTAAPPGTRQVQDPATGLTYTTSPTGGAPSVSPVPNNPAAGLSNGTAPLVDTTTGRPAFVDLFRPGQDATVATTAGDDADRARYYGNTAVPEDIATLRMQRDALQKKGDNFQDRTAPQAITPKPTAVAQADGTFVAPAAQSQTPTVGPAVAAAPSRDVTAGTVAAGQIAPIERVTATQVAPTAGAVAGNVDAATIDTSQQQQFRTGQQDLVSQLQAAARGEAPSAAEQQLKRANDDAVATQLGTVGLNHGRGANSALRNAGRTIAGLQQKNAADTAGLRATEQATARGQLGAALGTGREQDIGLATHTADLTQDASKTSATLNTNVAISNADRDAARNMKDADLRTAATAGNAAAQNELAKRQAELDTGANTTTEQLKVEAGKSNQATDTAKALADAAAKNRLTELQATIASQNGIANAEQQNEMAKLQAQLTQDTSKTNTSETNTTARADAANKLQVTIQNLDAQLKQQGMDDAQRQAYIDDWIRTNGQTIGWDTVNQQLDDAKKFDPNTLIAPLIEAGAAAGAKASDHRVKKDVTKVSDDAAMRLAKVLGEPSEWTYKGNLDDGHRHVGWMAQDLEKDPLGAKFVREDESGMKAVDYQGLTAALLAAALRSRKSLKGART